MAFGSWIKKVAKKISDGFKKVVPIVKKVGKAIKTTVAPIIGTIGNAIGGRVGSTLGRVSEISSDVADRTISITDKVNDYIKLNKSHGKNIPSGVPGIYYK